MFAAILAALVFSAHAGDAPEISRSVGEPGGVVVLWPRVIPRTDQAVPRATALQVQRYLTTLVATALPGRPVDVRPEPERACPQSGCQAITVSALVVHNEASCVVVGLVGAPGRSPTQLLPWAGKVDLKQAAVPFREYPESNIVIRDFLRCDGLQQPLQDAAAPILQAITAAGVTQP